MDPVLAAEHSYRVETIRRHHREGRALAEWLGRVLWATKERLPRGRRQALAGRGMGPVPEVRHTEDEEAHVR